MQLPFPKPSHRWCVLGVDLRDALRSYTSSPYACIRAITMCSWLTVRTMFTSDYKFNLTVSCWVGELLGAERVGAPARRLQCIRSGHSFGVSWHDLCRHAVGYIPRTQMGSVVTKQA